MQRTRTAITIVAALLSTSLAAANEVATSFEFNDASGSFTLGTPPETVTFAGGIAGPAPGLTVTGANAWMISPGQTGTITFNTPVETCELFFRDEFAGSPSQIDVIDTTGGTVLSVTGSTAFQKVSATVLINGPLIQSVAIKNNSGVGLTAIDDFSMCVIAGGGPLNDPVPGPIPTGNIPVQLVEITGGLVAPLWGVGLAHLPGHLFVIDQPGVLYAIELASGQKIPFLDVSAQLVSLGIGGPGTFDERGLLGIAFHPDYKTNGLLYTYTSEPANAVADFSTMPPGESPNHQSVITEWKVQNPLAAPDPSDPSTLVDPSSERELMRIDEPQFNHDGGAIAFGPDDLLYIALGDGGAADDQGTGHAIGGNGQDPTNVLGSVLRIDPTGSDSANGKYGIPATNPFVGPDGIPDETFAYGFRNPFRFSFDIGTPSNPGTGDLWLADVGQNDIEEIDVVTAGGNFGWPCKEGSFFFNASGDQPGFVTDTPPHEVPAGLIDPVAEYDHDEGIAIIGGFVYRGAAIPALQGRYVFGEFAQTFAADGRLFHLDAAGSIVEFPLVGQNAVGLAVLGFAQDAGGELYLLGNASGLPFPDPQGNPTGVVLRLAPEAPFVDLGHGTPGAFGVPSLTGQGTLTAGSQNSVTLENAAPGAPLVLFVGATRLDGLLFGAIPLVPFPDIVELGQSTDGAGMRVVNFTWPASIAPGTQFFFQYLIQDAGGTFGFAASNAVQATSG